MRKSGILFLTFLFVTSGAMAHTISKHLEELYGELYLPVFIFAKILPFVGLGMLSDDSGESPIKLKNTWIALLGVFTGFVISQSFSHQELLVLLNRFCVVVLGIILLLANAPARVVIQTVLFLFSITLSYEYGWDIAHSVEFKWLFVGLIITGLSIFFALNSISFFEKKIKVIIRRAAGVLFLLAGIMVILLA